MHLTGVDQFGPICYVLEWVTIHHVTLSMSFVKVQTVAKIKLGKFALEIAMLLELTAVRTSGHTV